MVLIESILFHLDTMYSYELSFFILSSFIFCNMESILLVSSISVKVFLFQLFQFVKVFLFQLFQFVKVFVFQLSICVKLKTTITIVIITDIGIIILAFIKFIFIKSLKTLLCIQYLSKFIIFL